MRWRGLGLGGGRRFVFLVLWGRVKWEGEREEGGEGKREDGG